MAEKAHFGVCNGRFFAKYEQILQSTVIRINESLVYYEKELPYMERICL